MTITIKPKAIDVDVLVDAARSQLLTNATVVASTAIPNTTPTQYAVYSEIAPEGITGAAAYVVLALASTVYQSNYNDPTISALLDVSAYTTGNSTTTVRALITACLAALIDSSWVIAGMTTVGATMEMSGSGFRSLTEVSNGVIIRGRQFTLRVIALKT
jgi:hypothetical protein